MYGNIQVKLVEVEETSDFIIRTFDITKVRDGGSGKGRGRGGGGRRGEI